MDTLPVGSIVHKLKDLEDLEGKESTESLNTLKPACVKFYNEYEE